MNTCNILVVEDEALIAASLIHTLSSLDYTVPEPGLFLSREILSITGITIRETGDPGKGARFEIAVPKGTWRLAGKGA